MTTRKTPEELRSSLLAAFTAISKFEEFVTFHQEAFLQEHNLSLAKGEALIFAGDGLHKGKTKPAIDKQVFVDWLIKTIKETGDKQKENSNEQ